LSADRIRDLELRAQAVHPDEPVTTAREVLAFIHQIQDAAVYATQIGTVRELATEWIGSRDIQQAAAGRIVLAALGGRQDALTGLT
jgi:hypothetical protein